MACQESLLKLAVSKVNKEKAKLNKEYRPLEVSSVLPDMVFTDHRQSNGRRNSVSQTHSETPSILVKALVIQMRETMLKDTDMK